MKKGGTFFRIALPDDVSYHSITMPSVIVNPSSEPAFT